MCHCIKVDARARIFLPFWKCKKVCCRLCEKRQQFVLNCFLFSFGLSMSFICRAPFYSRRNSKTKSVNGNWHLALWWGSLFNLFVVFFFILARIYKHTRTSRYHQRWQCYALNRFRMPFKFVQNTSILLAMRCGIYIFRMAHTHKWFKIGRWDSLQFKNPICSFHSGCSLSLSLSPPCSLSRSRMLSLFSEWQMHGI